MRSFLASKGVKGCLSCFSAGIGRTGTFVALDFLLRRAAVETHIDVFRTVTDMRYQRTNFVQTDVSTDSIDLLCVLVYNCLQTVVKV